LWRLAYNFGASTTKSLPCPGSARWQGIANLTVPGLNGAAGPSWADDARTRAPTRPPLPSRNHRPRGLAAPRLRFATARRGAGPGRALRPQLQEHPAAVPRVRRRLRPRAPRRRRPRSGNAWCLDEALICIGGVVP
jgi:hypothetical protein